MSPTAQMLAGLLPSIRYVEELARASSRDFVVIAGERGPVAAILGVDTTSPGSHVVVAVPRGHVRARLLGAGVPRETLSEIEAPCDAGQMLLVVATAERWGVMRFPRAEIAHIRPRVVLDHATLTMLSEAAPRGAGGLAN